MLFITGRIQRQRCQIQCRVMKLTGSNQNQIPYKMCISDFFIFGKLTEWHRFVTYLQTNPRTYNHSLLIS